MNKLLSISILALIFCSCKTKEHASDDAITGINNKQLAFQQLKDLVPTQKVVVEGKYYLLQT